MKFNAMYQMFNYNIQYVLTKARRKFEFLLISLGPGLLQSPDLPLPKMRRQSRATNLLLNTAERLGPRATLSEINADALLPALRRYRRRADGLTTPFSTIQ